VKNPTERKTAKELLDEQALLQVEDPESILRDVLKNYYDLDVKKKKKKFSVGIIFFFYTSQRTRPGKK
jgi:hypothetical protein